MKKAFNKVLGLAIACPLTNTNRNFSVKSKNLTGFIMYEQIKSIDYNARQVKFVEKLDEESLNKVLGITESIIF